MNQNQLKARLFRVADCGGNLFELETAARVEAYLYAGRRDQLFAVARQSLQSCGTGVEQCRLLCLMYELMTAGGAWSAKMDGEFVNAFLNGSERWMQQACDSDGEMRAALCQASAYYLYCQDADFNANVGGFVERCVEDWQTSLDGNRWHGATMSLALDRIAAMQAWAQTEADFALMDRTAAIIDAYADEVLQVGTVEEIVRLHDLAVATGVLQGLASRIEHRLKAKLDDSLSDADQFAAQSVLFEAECHGVGSLSAG